jgi:hypothetical protein
MNQILQKFKTEHPKFMKNAAFLGKCAFWGASVAIAAGTAYVFCNQPKDGKNSWRAHHKRNGQPKVMHKTAESANFQVIKDLVVHRTLMKPYQCQTCGGYHVGHEYK